MHKKRWPRLRDVSNPKAGASRAASPCGRVVIVRLESASGGSMGSSGCNNELKCAHGVLANR